MEIYTLKKRDIEFNVHFLVRENTVFFTLFIYLFLVAFTEWLLILFVLCKNKIKWNKIKFKRKKGRRGKEYLTIEAAVWHCEPCRKSLYLYTFTCWLLLQRIISLDQDPCSLLHQWCWAITGTLPGHRFATLCLGDPAVLGPYDRYNPCPTPYTPTDHR